MTKELIIRSSSNHVDFALLKDGKLIELQKEEDNNNGDLIEETPNPMENIQLLREQQDPEQLTYRQALQKPTINEKHTNRILQEAKMAFQAIKGEHNIFLRPLRKRN